MADYEGKYVYLSTHEFKNDIARWTRLLEKGTYKALLITRHGHVVAVYFHEGAQSLDESLKLDRARREERSLNIAPKISTRERGVQTI